MTEEQIFQAALDLPDASARAAYLDEHCGANVRLRGQVEALLAAHFQSGEFMDVPAPEQIAVEPSLSHAVTIQSDAMSSKDIPDAETDRLEFLAPSSRPDSLGRIGHYEVLQVLGKGGFGIVFRAFDDVLQRVVAVKVMAPQLAATSPARKRFLREARTSAQVRHENVVQVYEVGEQPLPYLVMEFIPGETLQQMLDRMGPLDVGETVRIGRQIAEGLAAAHATDLIHRDIKPGNVLLEGGQHKVKITDFGLARAADDASLTQSGLIAGTPMYMAPEQVLGHTLDQRADLFSLGSVLYQMVAGRPPFRANTMVAVLKRVAEDTPRNIREVIPETPEWLCGLIAKLHAKKPEDRYQSAREVADVLADCEAQLKVNPRLSDFSRISRTSSQRAGAWQWMAVAAVLLPILALTIAGFASVTNWFRGGQPVVAGAPRAMPINDAKLGSTTDGFVSLFNGKDLTGWKTHPERLGQWKVEHGALVGSAVPSFLFSDGTFRNFHLRLEAKINHGGDSGIFFRTPFAMRPGRTAEQARPASGYEVELQRNPTYANKTGSVLDAETAGPPQLLWKNELTLLPSTDEWCMLEIIADGNRIISKVNGTQTADCRDPRSRYEAGHLALQVYSPQTIVQFRKIEIKELPSSPTATDGFVALFNGKDLTGWKTHPDAPGDWRVEDGAIVGRGGLSFLLSESPDYVNFHLRVEAKINPTGDSGILFRRSSFRMPDPNKPGEREEPDGWEAQIGVRPNFLVHTGSLWAGPTEFKQAPLLLHAPNEWFVLEVIADGSKVQTRVNGKPAAEYHDNKQSTSRGHIALQTWGKNITAVQFRKIEIKELPGSPPTPDGFVALFNGKDLTGWKPHSKQPGQWEVKDGILTGSMRRGALFSERGDYTNFHLRVQAKVNLGGDSQIFIRAGSATRIDRGYEVEIHKNRAYAWKTGTVEALRSDGPPLILGLTADDSLTKPDEWFTLEIIAEQGHFITKVNGHQTANCSDPTNPHATGHIGLQVWSPNTVVQFRKIEIKELPGSPPTTDGFVALFNGQDLTGWKSHPNLPGHWEVKDGVLVGSRVQGNLYSERGDFANFHLRVQAKVNLGGDSGIFFRAGSDPRLGAGYEAEIHKNRTYARKTGTIEAYQPNGPPLVLGLVDNDSLTRPDEWFEMEIIAQQGHFITRINGQETANCSEPTNPHAAGHIGLQVWNPDTVVQFRKIEIKELPASPPVFEGFVQLFNGKNLDGWQAHPAMTESAWRVENDELVGSGAVSYLFYRSVEYGNLHLRTEFQVNNTGNSGIYIRSPFPQAEDGPHPKGYEAQIIGRGAAASNYKTGSLINFSAAEGTRIDADTWYTLEVLADGPQLQVKLNGVTTIDVRDEKGQYARGHVALQLWDPGTAVRFRKIEIKELRSTSAPAESAD